MLPFFAVVLPILVLLSGLLIDVGLMENQSLAMQTAADAAALGAELEWERGTSNYVQIAKQVASLNGFTQGDSGVIVSVAQRPSSGAFAGEFDAIEVDISEPVSTFFLQYLTSPLVAVRSVALIPPCTLLTGSSSVSGIPTLFTNQSTLNLQCPVDILGTLNIDSASTLRATAWNLSGASAPASSFTPAPRTNAPKIQDPLAVLSQPAPGSCTRTSFTQNGGTAQLSPGTYCKGMSLSNARVTLAPGLYVITGGAHWHGAKVSGSGVTLFLTQGGGAAFGQFIVDGNSTVVLSAPVTSSAGGLPGVLLFTDRQWTPTGAYDLQILSSTVKADGVIYATNAGLLLSASKLSPMTYLALDLPTLSLTSSELTTAGDFSSISSGSPFRPLGGNVE